MPARVRIRAGRRGHYPTGIEKAYEAKLVRRAQQIHELLMERLREVVTMNDRGSSRADDASPGPALPGPALRQVVPTVAAGVEARMAPSTAYLTDIGTDIDVFASADTRRQVELAAKAKGDEGQIRRVAAIGVLAGAPAVAAVSAWAAANLALIKSADERYFADVVRVIEEAARRGDGWPALEKALIERAGVSASRAKLIARDQVGTLNAQITAEKQRLLGITHFIWSSTGDERTRQEHEELHGRVFSWAEGHPTEGYPGEPILCRCSAIPVVP